jgi:trimeric autotransporter adhesin
MFSKRTIRRVWSGTLAAVGTVALAATFSVTGAKEAKAACVAIIVIPGALNCVGNAAPNDPFNIMIGLLNGSGNGNTGGVGTSEFDLQAANLYIGAINGSGNGNSLNGDAFNLAIGNAYIGAANGSGNANSFFSDTTNVMIGNVAFGLANGSGNANAVGNPLTAGTDDASQATSVEVLNAYFGVGNGSLNANNLGSGNALNVQALNFGSGIGNLSGNGNVLDSDGTGDSQFIAIDNTVFGNLSGSGNGNSLNQGSANLSSNRIFGNASASLNGNGATSGNAEISDNFISGNASGSGNGNGVGILLGQESTGNAVMEDNVVFGQGSTSNNGNGGDTGNAVLQGNLVLGNESASNNGNEVIPVINDNGTPDDTTDDFIEDLNGDGSAEIIDNTVIGDNSLTQNNDLSNDGTATMIGNTVIGNESANGNLDEYNNNLIIGDGSGNGAGQFVQNNTVIGDDSGNAFASGAQGNVVMGNNAGNGITGSNNVAIGENAGNGLGNDDTAIGANATVTADHSTALGADAQATLNNQFVMGTSQDTYKAPGITSNLSQSRQSGPLEIVTSDANGNLATDNGAVFHQLNSLGNDVDKARSGVALAIAMEGPDLVDNERFGVSASWGNFDGENAFGMGFEGVLWNDFLTTGGRFAVTGGFGVGFVDNDNNNTFGHSFGSSDDNVWGGRVGGQWTWGHRAAAYAVPPEQTSLK